MNLHHPRKLSTNSSHSDKLTLPSISIMDDFLPTRTWIPPNISPPQPTKSLTTPPQPPLDQWKSPPYHNRNELSRDASYTYNTNLFPPTTAATTTTTSPQTSPSIQQSSSSSYFQYTSKSYNIRVDNDIDEVVKQCNTLTDTMIQNKSQFMNNTITTRPLLDDMIGRANQVLNALLRLRKHQIASEQQIVDKSSNEPSNTWRMGSSSSLVNNQHSSHSHPQHHSTTTTTTTTTATNIRRKRGKRPAFQGRCHSCNISSTPEWRRGPDGARTLCNACGLHYAKLARKQQESRGMSSVHSSILGHSNNTNTIRRSSHHSSLSKLTPSPPPADDIILDRSPTG